MTTDDLPQTAESTLSDGSDTPADSNLVRKLVIGAAGGTVTAAGLVMLVTPGPGIIVSLAGLGILGSEFPAAKRALERLRNYRRTEEPK